MAKVVFLMADYGHDPSETAVPFTKFEEAGFHIAFATEKGKVPQCDTKMLEGITQLILGAKKTVVEQYKSMSASSPWNAPLSWSAPDFRLDAYDLVFLPGGHDKGVRQVIDSPAVHALLASFFPQTRKDGGSSRKAVGAVCHGVMVLSETKRLGDDGKSVLHGVKTTALPTRFEQLAFWGTRLFLGDYYKTYGACSENVQESVTRALERPEDFQNSLAPAPFVVEDDHYNYVSARFPGDVDLLGDKLVALFKSITA
ncbi:ThiJ/PfpI family protein [Cordyceps fumosorosea ARSEF 2679]|uniref:ThiJ/PfpI family protein n=1 Tax=Cordyceps fumosorosea (strain ARSEF 2679) TaxID=1081104 RepID=A0A162J4Z9_CORFA|nr:ThiJ/PfpI family protein [Cordyceps fumosorosea ARSEF 2679]OAA63802.1 ThiJ/PfpI family protein [Cordyceps fumosorosea ARSEF 2679]